MSDDAANQQAADAPPSPAPQDDEQPPSQRSAQGDAPGAEGEAPQAEAQEDNQEQPEEPAEPASPREQDKEEEEEGDNKEAEDEEPEDDEVTNKFRALLALLARVVDLVGEFAQSDHSTYGNLEYLARCARNTAHIVVWATLSEDNAAVVALPLETLTELAEKAIHTFDYMKANQGGFLYSARRQLSSLEDVLGQLEGIYEPLLSRAISLRGADSLNTDVRNEFGALRSGLVDMDAAVEAAGCAARLAALSADARVLAAVLNPHLAVPDHHPSPHHADEEREEEEKGEEAAEEAEEAEEEEEKEEEAEEAVEVMGPPAAKPKAVADQPLPVHEVKPSESLAVSTARALVGLFTGRRGTDVMGASGDLDFAEVQISRNCVAILRGCQELVQHDYQVYGNLEFMARVVNNLGLPLLHAPMDEFGGPELVEPFASVLAYTTQARAMVATMCEGKGSLFRSPKRELQGLESVFFRLEPLVEGLGQEFVAEGETEARVGAVRTRLVDLDDPLEEDGVVDRVAVMVVAMEGVCGVLTRRRQATQVFSDDEDEGEDVEEEEDAGEGEESVGDLRFTQGKSKGGSETELDRDGFVDVGSLVRVERGEVVGEVDPFAVGDRGGDRWYFVAPSRLRPALLNPSLSSLYVAVRCLHDAQRFLDHHLVAVSPSAVPNAPGPRKGEAKGEGENEGEGEGQGHHGTDSSLVDMVRAHARGGIATEVGRWWEGRQRVVVVAGAQGSGKSALVNALLGWQCLPTGRSAVPAKRVPLVLRFDARDSVRAVTRSGRGVSMTRQELPAWLQAAEGPPTRSKVGSTAGDPGDATTWSHVEVCAPHALLRCGLVVVEVPDGVDVGTCVARVRRLVASADVGVVVVDARVVHSGGGGSVGGLDASSVHAFHHLHADLGLECVVVAVNKMDRVQKAERAGVGKAVTSAVHALRKDHDAMHRPLHPDALRTEARAVADAMFASAVTGQWVDADSAQAWAEGPSAAAAAGDGPQAAVTNVMGGVVSFAGGVGDAVAKATAAAAAAAASAASSGADAVVGANAGGAGDEEPDGREGAQHVRVVCVSARQAIIARTGGEGGEGVAAAVAPGKLVLAPFHSHDEERFHESAVGQLEMWLARAMVQAAFAPHVGLMERGAVAAQWGVCVGALAASAHAKAKANKSSAAAVEAVLPRVHVAQLRALQVARALDGQVQGVRRHVCAQAVALVEGVAEVLRDRYGTPLAKVQRAASLENIARQFSASSGGGGGPSGAGGGVAGGGGIIAEGPLSAYDDDSSALLALAAQRGGGGGGLGHDVAASLPLPVAFAVQWRRWGAVVSACVCGATARRWCAVARAVLEAAEREAAGGLGEVRHAQDEVLRALVGDDGKPGQAEGAQAVGLAHSVRFTPRMRAAVVDAVVGVFEDSLGDELAVFQLKEQREAKGLLGQVLGGIGFGGGASQDVEAAGRAKSWVESRMPGFLEVNKSKLGLRVAEAVVADAVACVGRVAATVRAEMDNVVLGADSGLHSDMPVLEEWDGFASAKSVVDEFLSRTQWLRRTSLTSVAQAPAWGAEQPAASDAPLYEADAELDGGVLAGAELALPAADQPKPAAAGEQAQQPKPAADEAQAQQPKPAAAGGAAAGGAGAGQAQAKGVSAQPVPKAEQLDRPVAMGGGGGRTLKVGRDDDDDEEELIRYTQKPARPMSGYYVALPQTRAPHAKDGAKAASGEGSESDSYSYSGSYSGSDSEGDSGSEHALSHSLTASQLSLRQPAAAIAEGNEEEEEGEGEGEGEGEEGEGEEEGEEEGEQAKEGGQ